ncbi:MAG: twin-arginine translocase subunit TatC [Methylophilaceae bacterium]|nr:twin-arginine translocase subunit TatC [Methylophilaceae bacterium]
MNTTETFISHLIELRDRLLRIVIGFVLVFIALIPFANKIYTLLAHPLLSKLPSGGQMIATAVTTPFLVPMKVAMLAAFIISLPYTLYQVWSFVAPGLYAQERRFMAPIVLASSLLFLAGMCFAYFLVFPVVFGFIATTAPEGVAVMTDIGNYLDFVITLFIAFGLAFEVPVAVVLLVRFGWVDVSKLKEIRSYVIVGAFVLGAIFTPPDVVSQIMLAVPLWLLYEVGILAAGFVQKRTVPPEAEPE